MAQEDKAKIGLIGLGTMGSALALNIAQNAALRGGAGVGIFSLEMGKGQLVTRMLSSEARVDAHKMRTGYLSMNEDWPRLEEASERLYHAPLWIVDTPALTITQIRSKARRLKSEHPELAMLMIDYLQLMQGDGGSNQSREQQISAISRGLKGLAKELELPVIALSQLNRAVESRPNKRPLLSDLRESGAIEQDADMDLFKLLRGRLECRRRTREQGRPQKGATQCAKQIPSFHPCFSSHSCDKVTISLASELFGKSNPHYFDNLCQLNASWVEIVDKNGRNQK